MLFLRSCQISLRMFFSSSSNVVHRISEDPQISFLPISCQVMTWQSVLGKEQVQSAAVSVCGVCFMLQPSNMGYIWWFLNLLFSLKYFFRNLLSLPFRVAKICSFVWYYLLINWQLLNSYSSLYELILLLLILLVWHCYSLFFHLTMWVCR